MAEDLALDSRPDKAFSLSRSISVWFWGPPDRLSLFLTEELSPGSKMSLLKPVQLP
jgi:hypothetical protein